MSTRRLAVLFGLAIALIIAGASIAVCTGIPAFPALYSWALMLVFMGSMLSVYAFAYKHGETRERIAWLDAMRKERER